MNTRTAKLLIAAGMVLLNLPLPLIAQSASGLEVSNFQSRYVPSWGPHNNGLTSSSDVNYKPATFELSAAFRNTGSKVITSVSWEFLFYSDAQQTQVMLKHKFREGKKIAPGQEVRVKRTAQIGAATDYKAVRITRVVYDDGTTWQSPKTGN